MKAAGAHRHQWSATGIVWPEGIAAPCLVGDCAGGLLQSPRRGLQYIHDAFPMAVAGVPLDIEDTGGGGVAKIVCHEAATSYRLQDIPLEPGDRVVDIGAHVGVVTCYLAKRHPDIVIHAVEPVPPLYRLLRRNIAANVSETPHRVVVQQAAVGGDGGTVDLYGQLDLNSGGFSAFIGHGYKYTVDTVSLERIIGDGPVRLLKIDCEGAEHIALTDAVLDRVEYLVGEFHNSPMLRQRGFSAGELRRWCINRLGADRVRVSVLEI